MSDKPDDIPQWAWDAAEGPSIEAFDASVDLYETGMETSNVQLIVARAILQARTQAFEDAAQVADDSAFARVAAARSALADGDADASVLAAFQARHARVIAQYIRAQAIRQHSQKGRDNEQ